MTEGDLGRTTVCEHKIDTGTAKTAKQPYWGHPLQFKDAINKQLNRMLNSLVIKMSDWAAHVVLAKKKHGAIRFCIDYCQLNE